MNIVKHILDKRSVRADAFWTNPLVYQSFLMHIPIRLDTYALEKSQFWPRQALDAHAEVRLAMTVRRSATFPYWRELFERARIDPDACTLADFLRTPMTTKRDLVARSWSDFADETCIRNCYQGNTSGSTGVPFRFLNDPRFAIRDYALCERMLRTAGKGRRYPVISVRPRARADFAFSNKEFFFVRGFNALKERFPDFVDKVRSYPRGIILHGFTSQLAELGRLTAESGTVLPIHAIITSGEELRPDIRAKLEEDFRTEAHTCYATQELGWLAFECEHKKLHINEEAAFIETVDSVGNSVQPDSEGRIVVTTFDNYAMPFIRYYTGDVGVISNAPCPCGRTLRTMTFKGREARHLTVAGGRTVPLFEVSVVFDSFTRSLRQYQMIQTGPLSFRIKVVPGARFEEGGRELLQDLLVRALHPDVAFEWEIVDEILPAPSGKAVYFIDMQ